ncbi:hypothetical protein ACUOFC_49550, partial [Escherichia sp. TWPC-MK]
MLGDITLGNNVTVGADVLLQLFPGGGAIIHDDHLPVTV